MLFFVKKWSAAQCRTSWFRQFRQNTGHLARFCLRPFFNFKESLDIIYMFLVFPPEYSGKHFLAIFVVSQYFFIDLPMLLVH